MRRFFRRALQFKEVTRRLRDLEERINALEKIADERDALWLYIDEKHAQEVEAQKVIQEELEKVIVSSLTPQGDA